MTVKLSPGREARLRLAVYAAFDARAGDPDEFRRRIDHVIELYERLVPEQLAEQGYMPETANGCLAVLSVAARILELLRDPHAVA
jgi:hypothetical protein